MHINSLPSPYGIGTLGMEAYAFADFLSASRQRYWQVLPVGPTGFADSPYQPFSAFAGNPYLIDLELLIKDGLLERKDVEAIGWGSNPALVSYEALHKNRYKLLYVAFLKARETYEHELSEFKKLHEAWLYDYALFMALKYENSMRPWQQWGEKLRMREPALMHESALRLETEIEFHIYLQYLFFKQWADFKAYCNKAGVLLIGDIPFYVALDSSDVFANPEYFLLNEARLPIEVAGVPPDYFSKDGQLWGNPIYNWGSLKEEGYSWWLKRLDLAASLYDVIRIDHFRGFESYYSIPYGAPTAAFGAWQKGPGMDFIGTLKAEFKDLPIIAEDLGFLSEDVRSLLKESGFPGMKVLQFAFEKSEPSSYLPHTYSTNCVCYTGTHDNTTAMGWVHEADPEEVGFAVDYLGLNAAEGLNWGLIRGGMCSKAMLFIAPMQDLLGLSSKSRMNTPGTLEGNWQWRLRPLEAGRCLSEKIAYYTRMYGRG